MESRIRTVHQLICTQCGRQFTSQRSDAKCCCNACRQQAYLIRSAPDFVQKQLTYIEDELRFLETRHGYLTAENVDHVFAEIKELVNHWHYRKLPYEHKLRDVVEGDLVRKLEVLRMKLKHAR